MATAVFGMQWGDEGKGKVAHLLARNAEMVVRFNGGPNAGHTVVHDGATFGIHQIPVGAFYQRARCVLAAGVVIDPWTLRKEYDELTDRLGHRPAVEISETAHLILPYHRLLEELEGSGAKIGTTGRGIGPAYRDRAARSGIRAGDLLHPADLADRIGAVLDLIRSMWGGDPRVAALSVGEIVDDLMEASKPFLPRITDTSRLLEDALAQGKRILFEGAQGALLDVDYGTYPYVTSSATTFLGLAQSIGVALAPIDQRIGVLKAYTTRVGKGAFPTELDDRSGERLRQRGGEFGVTTGRPRRCGWLDLVALRHAVRLNRPTGLAITKLDILDDLDAIKVCRAYRLRGEIIERMPSSPRDLEPCEPIYETLPGWKTRTAEARSVADLPRAARAYLDAVSHALDVPVALISVGPEPEATIVSGFESV